MDQTKKVAVGVLGALVVLGAIFLFMGGGDTEREGSTSPDAGTASGLHDCEMTEFVPEGVQGDGTSLACQEASGAATFTDTFVCEIPEESGVGGNLQTGTDGQLQMTVEDPTGTTVFEETYEAGTGGIGETVGQGDVGEWTMTIALSDDWDSGQFGLGVGCSSKDDSGSDDAEGSGDEQGSSTSKPLAIQTPATWPGPGFDERRTSAYNSEGGGTGEELYRIDVNETSRRGDIPPVVASGLIYVALQDISGSSRTGLVNAYNVSTGAEVFSFETENPLSAPMVAGDGLLFVQTDENGLYALDENGETAWHSDGGDESTAMTFADGVIYATLNEKLFALDVEDGEVIWQETAPEERPGFTGHPVVLDDTILVPAGGASDDDANLYALDRESQEIEWVYKGAHAAPRPVLVSDGAAFLGGHLVGGIHAVDIETGEQRWSVDRSAQRYPGMLRALPGGEILVRNETKLEALDPDTGELVWQAQVESDPDNSLYETHAEPRAVVVTEQTVYAWSAEGQRTVQAFDAETGEMEGLSETHTANNAVAVDGVLFSIGRDGPPTQTQIIAADGGYS